MIMAMCTGNLDLSIRCSRSSGIAFTSGGQR
jgi:hypothetical protein